MDLEWDESLSYIGLQVRSKSHSSLSIALSYFGYTFASIMNLPAKVIVKSTSLVPAFKS